MMMMCIINTVYEDEHKRYYDHQVRMWVALFALCVAPTNSNRTEGEGAVSHWHRHNHCCRHTHHHHSVSISNTYQWREHLPVLSKNSRALPIFHLCPQLERLRPVSWSWSWSWSYFRLLHHITGVTLISVIFESSITWRPTGTREDPIKELILIIISS